MPHPNIKLEYPVAVHRSMVADGGTESEVFYAKSAEVFVDEHGIQWVKFVATNGFDRGKEHMIRTDSNGFRIVRNEVVS